MSELDSLRAENYALRQRAETLDVALGGFAEASNGAISLLAQLTERFDDVEVLQSIGAVIRQWRELNDEIAARMAAFKPLPNAAPRN
ncbi:MAG: hypothetical protein WC670_09655 [Pseudolabrys sp.]|jgi:hypothetical protein